MPAKILAFKGEYEFLSNYHEGHSFLMDGFTFLTGEHAFHWLKTEDPEFKADILAARTPGQAKGLGRRCPRVPGWDEGRRNWAMTRVLMSKFHPLRQKEMARLLLGTGRATLVEGNNHGDDYWGAIWCNKAEEGMTIWHTHENIVLAGHNELGRQLHYVRARLSALTHKP
jgi:ribA/ribD-fused uncharacterized protein